MVDSARILQPRVVSSSKYTPISESDGKVEFQGVVQAFDTSSPIVAIPIIGEEFYNPNIDGMDVLVGKTKFKNIVVSGLLSKAQFLPLFAMSRTPKAKDGTMTATHQIGDIITILTGVRWVRLEFGNFRKTGSSASMIKLEFSFSGTGSTNDTQPVATINR
jgi:hypothetical protein